MKAPAWIQIGQVPLECVRYDKSRILVNVGGTEESMPRNFVPQQFASLAAGGVSHSDGELMVAH